MKPVDSDDSSEVVERLLIGEEDGREESLGCGDRISDTLASSRKEAKKVKTR
jgi:hypothetical protein